jgi:fimbrial isopeptide formation D2 family protein/LPXTG-motif cell wall-anchored protein
MKGKIRKLLSVVVATAMTLSCLSVPALAADPDYGEYTTSSTRFELYQIFTGTPSNEGLSNVKWGYNAALPSGASDGNVSQDVLNELEAVKNSSDIEKLNVIKKYWDQNSTAYSTAKNIYVGQRTVVTKDSEGKGVTTLMPVYQAFGLAEGYYLIVDKEGSTPKDDGSGYATGKYYSLYVTKVTGSSVIIEPKGSAAKVDKEIVETDGTKSDSTSASVGDEINYQLTGEVASNITSYGTYYYKFTDTLSAGLTYKKDSVCVYIDSIDNDHNVTQYFGKSCTENEGNENTLTVAISDLKRLGNIPSSDGGYKYTVNGSTKIYVTYTATLNKYAVVSDDYAMSNLSQGNGNSVKVTYSNDPNSSGTPNNSVPTEPGNNPPEADKTIVTGDTASAEATVYTVGIKIIKQAGTTAGTTSNEKLAGATFKLTGTNVNEVFTCGDKYTESADGTYYLLTDGTYTETEPTADTQSLYQDTSKKYVHGYVAEWASVKAKNETAVGITDNDGVISFTGLGAGTYKLEEVTAPKGYNKLTEPIEFTIDFNKNNKTFTNQITPTSGNIDGRFVLLPSNMYEITITNSKNSGLPTTGGIGTTIFYVAGTILVLGAAVALITRRRMKGEVK